MTNNGGITAVVAAAANDSASGEHGGGIVLSTGVVMRAKQVPKMAFLALRRRFKAPAVPLWRNTDKGRDEPNPDDPDYLAALAEYQVDFAEAQIHLLMLLGTETVSIPEGLPGPDDLDWLAERALLGLSSGDDPAARRLDWLLYKAAPTSNDIELLARGAGRATGTAEADVQEALKSSRRGA